MSKLNFSAIISSEWLSQKGIVDYGHTTVSVPETLDHYQNWIKRGEHGVLTYMHDHRASLREDLKHIFPKFQSALVFLFSYKDQAKALEKFYAENKAKQRIASYVLGFDGEDYHHAILRTLEEMKLKLCEQDSELEIMHSLDIQPILERDLAFRAGLGWFGKNSMLINRNHGSYFLIGSLLLSKDIQVTSQSMDVDHCGNCRACIEACPTDAINEQQRTVISNKCISTFTIEIFKEHEPPAGMVENSEGEIFGCDICQVVCPWNRKGEDDFAIFSEQMGEYQKLIYEFFLNRPLDEVAEELEQMSNKYFRKMFKGTALERTGRVGLLKNINSYRV